MNAAAASVISASPADPPIWNRIRKTSEFLRKLSLNAEKNWVQNRGAKRRVSSRDEDMASGLGVSFRSLIFLGLACGSVSCQRFAIHEFRQSGDARGRHAREARPRASPSCSAMTSKRPPALD